MTGAPDIVFTHYGVTQLHPLAFLATVAGGAAMLSARRTQAILPLALVACLIPGSQRLVVAGLDFNMIRILILFGWLRVLIRGELRPLRLNGIDIAFVAWITAGGAAYAIREGTVGALVNRLGMAFEAFGVYFLLRMLLRHPSDTLRAARYLAWCAALVAIGMAIELATGRNLFAILGGVSGLTMIRDGRLRCQGAFAHPIMAGSFGATLVPIFVGMWLAFPRWRQVAVVGAVSGLFIAVASASSGPALAVVAGFVAFACWPLRRNMRALRWGLLLSVAIAHFARERPVWHLIARLSNLMGGEGYHRYILIDGFVHRWREWWLVGTASTAHWGPILWDTTNQYVAEGVSGGILTLAAFVTLLSLSFRGVALAARAGLSLGRRPRAHALWCWGIGAALTAHAVSFISVSYFGQMQVIFYLLLALIAAERSFAYRRAGFRVGEPRAAAEHARRQRSSVGNDGPSEGAMLQFITPQSRHT
jgi:hypothetical protein